MRVRLDRGAALPREVVVVDIAEAVAYPAVVVWQRGQEAGLRQTGAALTTTTFNQMLPGVGGWIVTFGLVFFAYSTILGWCYYGEKCATYLVGDGGVLPYRMVYVASVMAGTVLSLDLVWSASDVFNGLMALPNLIALVLLSGVVVKETHDFFEKRRKGELP